MKKTMKSIISLALCSIILFGSIAVGSSGFSDILDKFGLKASAAEITQSGTCGENLTWTLDDEGTLTISGTGDIENTSNVPWYEIKDSIYSIVIENGATSIGGYAFCDCTRLSSITIPDSVTSIGDYAFYNCTSLTSITIPDSVTCIGSVAFSGCTGLTSITIPDSVTIICGDAFIDCTSLTSISVDEYNLKYSSDEQGVLFNKDKTELIQYPIGNERTKYIIPNSVTSISGWAFDDCTSLTSVTIPDSVTSISGWAFGDCTSLTSIIVDSENKFYSSNDYGVLYNVDKTSLIRYPSGSKITEYIIPDGVTSIGGCAFKGCTSLASITIPDSVTSIDDYSFSDCSNLISIKFGEISELTSIGDWAFADCTSLTSITIPDSVTNIGYDAFEDCTSLTSITIPEGVTSIGSSAFYGCTSLTSVTIGNCVTSIGYNVFNNTALYEDMMNWENGVLYIGGYLIEGDSSISGEYTIKAGTKTIASSAFGNCANLTSVTIPDGVVNICDSAFSDCYALNSISIPNSITSLGDSVFANCRGIINITIPDSVVSIGRGAFAACHGLINIVIPDSVTSISSEAFSSCTSLTSITIPDSVTSISSEAFSGCTSLTSITIPDSVTSIGSLAFNGCTSLASIIIPDSVKSIGDYAFYDTELYMNRDNWNDGVLYINNHLIIADNSLSGEYTIKDGTKSIASHAFFRCQKLTSLTIPNSITNISTCMLASCIGLISISIPNSVTNIGVGAFSKCTSLKSIVIPNSVTHIDRNAFKDLPITDVYYQGGKSDFDKISIDYGNDSLLSATKHFNSVDEKYDVSVSYNSDAFSENVTLSVTPVEGDKENGSVYIVDNVIREQISCFNIKMLSVESGEVVQPDGQTVRIKMPIPEKYIGKKNFRITHILDNGSRENFSTNPSDPKNKIEISPDGKYLSFDVSGFSKFELYTFEPISISINNKVETKTINYGETLRLTATATNLPEGAKIYWYVNGEKQGEGETFEVSPKSGSVKVTVKIVDADGNSFEGDEVSDSQIVSVKSGFFQKLISFFKNLFGISRTVIQAIYSIAK